MKQLTCFAWGFFALIGTTQAASFDCGKAALAVEKLICGDQVLSKYDENLNFAYKAALEDLNNAVTTRSAQKQWIKERNECPDVNCLRRKYILRIRMLEKSITSRPLDVNNFDADSCRMVSDYSNRGALRTLLVRRSKDKQPNKNDINRIFGTDIYGGVSYWYVDLNNDGILDHFVIGVDGTANVSTGFVLSRKQGAVVTTINDEDNLDLNLLMVDKQYYVLSRYENKLGKLWRMGLDGYFHSVCKFSQRNEPLIVITKGKDNPVCNAASSGAVKHVDFFQDVINGQATADIDNDGKPENLTLLDYESPAGRGCSSSMIRVVDKENPEKEELVKNILEQTFDGCNVKQGVFVYDGLTYIDEASSGVILIRNGKTEEICNWKIQLLYDVQR